MAFIKSIKKYFQQLLLGCFSIALVFLGMSELSIYAQFNWLNYIYFPIAMMVWMLYLFYSAKILYQNPVLLFLGFVLSFYLLVGHGFIITEWLKKQNGLWITAKSSSDLLQQIKAIKDKNLTIKAIKPLIANKVIYDYKGAYHYLRTRDSNRADVWFHAAPYANKQQVREKRFSIWIVCTVKQNESVANYCFDKLDMQKGGGYITSNDNNLKAVKNAIAKHKLKATDNPVILKWSQNIEAEISNKIQANSKIVKVIILAWMIISSLSFLFSLLFRKNNI